MSRAFVKESDATPDEPDAPPASAQLPPGVKNYMTADGARRMREELERLAQVERPEAARGDPAAAETKRRLQQLDRRIGYLAECLRSAEVLDVASQAMDVVRFGATVTVRNREGIESTYRIVGVDEIDLARGWVSWRSPLAASLMGARAADSIVFRSPTRDEQLRVTRIGCPPEDE